MFEFNNCGQEYDKRFNTKDWVERWGTEENFQDWYASHCAQCRFMNEVCMAGVQGEEG